MGVNRVKIILFQAKTPDFQQKSPGFPITVKRNVNFHLPVLSRIDSVAQDVKGTCTSRMRTRKVQDVAETIRAVRAEVCNIPPMILTYIQSRANEALHTMPAFIWAIIACSASFIAVAPKEEGVVH